MEKCAECVRLWRVYANATAHHIGLQNKLHEAVLTQLWESAEWTVAIDAAARMRESARDALRTHEELAHPKVSASAHG